ncbi:transcription regulator containing HTH domain-like protein [Thermoproteus uzoniensis 768-20]|uniref:Transcription regulator containing HTH domain-like protein n=1 Tax=Thermoproteus uzoniensis (strain 768-20) TaxID=999630 RepID=F2L4C5_THEU7|nr:transcriptional regulator [Thermoproteus uzoniensis]AEA13357.1 transcription regulator containing HTH domain-like protein [Thermoproteus uzoniensis 768-20]
MHRDKAVGIGLLILSVLVIVVYAWLVFLTKYDIVVLKATAFLAVAAVFGILGWVGYALATTPPPKPIEEIEKEVEQALKEIEKQMQEQDKGQTQ